MSKQRRLNCLIALSDLHSGCSMGLFPKGGFPNDSGQQVMPSKFQLVLWKMWEEFWGVWVPFVTRGEPYGVVINGDSIDNEHHGSLTPWTNNTATQRKCAAAILKPVYEQCEGRMWILRGTTAHDGDSGKDVEDLGAILHAIPDKEGRRTRWELAKTLGKHEEFMIHFCHTIGVTSSQSYESTAVHKELAETYVEAARWCTRVPNMVVRAHRHRYFKTEIATAMGRASSIVLPGWQGKTPFLYRVGLGRLSQPQFGGIMIRVSEEGELYERSQVWNMKPIDEE